MSIDRKLLDQVHSELLSLGITGYVISDPV